MRRVQQGRLRLHAWGDHKERPRGKAKFRGKFPLIWATTPRARGHPDPTSSSTRAEPLAPPLPRPCPVPSPPLPRLCPASPLSIGEFGRAALLLPISVLRPLLSDCFQAALAGRVRRWRPWREGGGTWPGCALTRPSCGSGMRCRGAATAPRSASRTGGCRAVIFSCCHRAGPR